jgi:hypothetical protein
VIPAALLTPRGRVSVLDVAVARATTRRGAAPVDLALIATASADAWAHGNGLPRPRAYLCDLMAQACRRVCARHHAFVDGAYHARATRTLNRIGEEVNATPQPVRAAVLCVALLDLLNDRPEREFTALSGVLSRLDRECPRAPGHDVEALASRIADAIREEFAR